MTDDELKLFVRWVKLLTITMKLNVWETNKVNHIMTLANAEDYRAIDKVYNTYGMITGKMLFKRVFDISFGLAILNHRARVLGYGGLI